MNEYLVKKFGLTMGTRIYKQQQRELKRLLQNTKETSISKRKVLKKQLLPNIAYYKTLQKVYKDSQKAQEVFEDWINNEVGAALHKSYLKMEKFPFFYQLYRFGFEWYTRHSDLWETETKRNQRDQVTVHFYRCFWKETCANHGCPELCQYFCKVDNVTYGGLRKMGMKRTQTLGAGGSCCDFTFYKK